MTVNARLIDALEANGVRQGELAQRVGVGPSTVANWVKGLRTPGQEELVSIAIELGVPLVWLQTGNGGTPASVRELRERRTAGVGWAARRVPEDGGRVGGNPALFAIQPTLGSVAREATQNALDVRLGGAPARVDFRLNGLTGEAKARFLTALRWPTLRGHLQACIDADPGQQVATALTEGLQLDQGELLVLTISDYNTTGLTGVEFGKGSNFAALVRDTLFSEKGSSGTAGGSYGLGSFTAVAASAANCVLYHSDLYEPLDDGRAVGRLMGRAELTWHEDGDGDRDYAGPMWFGDVDPDHPGRADSHWAAAGEDLVADLRLRRREGTGTTVAIVGLRDLDAEVPRSPEEMVGELRAAITASFFAAIEAGHLEARVDYLPVSRPADGPDPEPGQEALLRPERDPVVRGLVDALDKHNKGDVDEELVDDGDVVRVSATLKVPAREDGSHGAFEHAALVLVRRADVDDRDAEAPTLGHVAMMREPRMTVRSLNVSRAVVGASPFQALLLAGRAVGDSDEHTWAESFLRAAEPPSHDHWEGNETVRQRYKRGGKGNLVAFERAIRDAVRAVVVREPEPDGDGPRDLSRRFRLGNPESPERAPRVTVTSAELSGGAWAISGRVRVPKGRDAALTCRPRLIFTGETGKRATARWERLEPVRDCELNDDGALVIPRNKRTALFRAVSDPDSHPVPAAEAAVMVDLRVEAKA